MKNKKIKCDIYTRVSTTMQVDGYSLDAQKEKLKRYAEFQNMEIVNEYSDEGKSGKSVEGRPEFQRMLDNIENGTDEVQFVLVFKLSRFGRNAADVLNSLQRMQDFGVNLICVEDGIDSSKDSGKLMISVLSAVAEIERENILVQTMEGRKQKAREGKWNGGFAPYGYELVNGELQIAEDEAEIIRLIYDKFIHTNMGISAIAAWLNQHGYKKKKRQNNTLDAFASSFIKGVLDNPVYCGKLAYGRRKNEKVSGTRNEYRIVKQENYMLHDGIHEGIISETDWELAHQKREKTGVKYEKTHSLDHEHILSGILRCPLCGSGMYGNVNRKKKKDGTLYKDYFYYVCKHRRLVDGHKCGYRKQWSEEKINNAVEEVIRKLVKNPKFEEAILNKIGSRIDTEEIEKEITIINHLKKDGIKVPSYIKTINDTYYSLYKNKVIIIQKFIEGYTLNRNEGNYEQTIECAKVYGMIVKSLENLDILLPLNDLSYLFSKEIFEKSIEKHQELLKIINDKDDEETLKIKRDLEEKINMIKDISEENIFIDTKKLTIKNTHGDFNVLQFIYKNNHINSVIDFVSACKMPIVWELIRSYSYIDKTAQNGIFNLDTFTNYIKEFNKCVKLNEYDLKYMSYIYLIQLLSSTYGYKEYINNNVNVDLLKFGCFRTNICKYLFKNAENISNRLLKNIKI